MYNKIFYSLFVAACVVSAALLLSYNRASIPSVPIVTKKLDTVQKLQVVFVITNKDIDFNQMAIKEIISKIENDSLEIKALSHELYLKPQIIKVYKVEDITCPYLKKRFLKDMPGQLVYEYNGKVLVKLKDGIIKVYHSHIETTKTK